MTSSLERIVSGGQTGADQAALDWAIQNRIPHGGWCPKGRRSEAGPILARYQLRETPSPEYAVRTEWNVRDAGATVIFSCAETLSGGTALTRKLAIQYGRPWIHLYAGLGTEAAAARLQEFVERYPVRVLNVAGPRASEESAIATFVTAVLSAAF